MKKKYKYNNIKIVNAKKILGHNWLKEFYVVDGIIKKQSAIPVQWSGGSRLSAHEIDCKDCIVAPGFIDPQINGYKNCNFWNSKLPSFSEIDKVREELAYHGVVGFLPTIITSPKGKIIKFINHINKYLKHASGDIGAKILGVHIEGVFITKYGVHEEKFVNKKLSIKNLKPFIKENVVLFTLAPELDKDGSAINFLRKNNILVSVGHSNASYNEGLKVINKHGVDTVTHMFNALSGIEGFSHRNSKKTNLNLLISKLKDKKKINPVKDGIMLAALKEKKVLCMVICDGLHVNKEVVSFLKKYKNKNNFSLVSDYVASPFFKKAKSNNMLGGGQTTLDKCVSNLINWNVSSVENSLLSASLPISKKLKVCRNDRYGEIVPGKKANFIIWHTKKKRVKGTIIGENVFLNF